MSSETSKVTIHMVSSLDGFIAKRDGSVSWLQSNDTYENGITLTNEDIEAYLEKIDCYVMGSKTYEHAVELGWPYGNKPVFVLTNRALKTNKKNVEFYSEDLSHLINEYLKPRYKNIWMVGGAMLTKEFIRQNLADEIIISFIPILLGEGTLFFDHIRQEQNLHLKDIAAYKDGMVELTYEIKK